MDPPLLEIISRILDTISNNYKCLQVLNNKLNLIQDTLVNMQTSDKKRDELLEIDRKSAIFFHNLQQDSYQAQETFRSLVYPKITNSHALLCKMNNNSDSISSNEIKCTRKLRPRKKPYSD